ncbi:hypothetical protein, partial [Rubripirellula obstinata]|uniref:hypothetical protein n=1 Tax=Rubripirellula obstinata TaxID=406547 RepID=UPI001EE44D62
DQQIPLPKNFQFAMFILQFAMFDWFANNITHRIFISPAVDFPAHCAATQRAGRSPRDQTN